MLVEGSIYVVNLNRLKWTGLARRNFRALRYIREFVRRHSKAEKVILDASINEFILSRSSDNLPARVAVCVTKLDDAGKVVKASLAVQVVESEAEREGK